MNLAILSVRDLGDFASLAQRRAVICQKWEKECEDRYVFSIIENTVMHKLTQRMIFG
jgi:hypothetical protein